MIKLSVTIITLNEEKNIEKCLTSLKDLVNEIIVLDSGSTDKTVNLAKKNGAKVFFRDFDNFANQKNAAADYASGEWLLSLDADEIISEELANEIKEAITKDKFDGYLIPRRNFILGGEIKHSRWSPDKHIWLWKKNHGRWVGVVHEEVIVKGKVGELKNSKLHYQGKTLSEFFLANNKYSSLFAEKLSKEGVRFSFKRLFWEAFFEFSLRFFYKKGFLDQWRGFVLCYIMAIYKLMVWVKIWELQNLTQK